MTQATTQLPDPVEVRHVNDAIAQAQSVVVGSTHSLEQVEHLYAAARSREKDFTKRKKEMEKPARDQLKVIKEHFDPLIKGYGRIATLAQGALQSHKLQERERAAERMREIEAAQAAGNRKAAAKAVMAAATQVPQRSETVSYQTTLQVTVQDPASALWDLAKHWVSGTRPWPKKVLEAIESEARAMAKSGTAVAGVDVREIQTPVKRAGSY